MSGSPHNVYRDGKLYDTLHPDIHHMIQIVHSFAVDDPGHSYELKSPEGEVYYKVKVSLPKKVSL